MHTFWYIQVKMVVSASIDFFSLSFSLCMCIHRYFIDLVSIPSPGIFPLKIYKLPSKKFGDRCPK